LALPYANLFWTRILTVIIGMVLASAFSVIVVYAQELMPGRVGMIAGLFFGVAFGISGIGAAVLGALADRTDIYYVYRLCSYLPGIGVLAFWLPRVAPAPLTLISSPAYSVTRAPACSSAPRVRRFPASMTQSRGPSASTLVPIVSNSVSGTSTSAYPRSSSSWRNGTGSSGEYTTARSLSTGLMSDIRWST